jgi:hypothetical protein
MFKYNLHWNGGFSGHQLCEDGVPENWDKFRIMLHAVSMNVRIVRHITRVSDKNSTV